MKVFATLCWVITMASSAVLAQKTGPANSSGECAISHSGNYDTITIKNCGIGETQGQEIISLLNRIVANQADIGQMEGQLNACLKNVGMRVSSDIFSKAVTILKASPTRSRISIRADQYSASAPIVRQVKEAFTAASDSWTVTPGSPNAFTTVGGVSPPEVEVSEYGDPVAPGASVQLFPGDPAYYAATALKMCGLNPTIGRYKKNSFVSGVPGDDFPRELIVVTFTGGFAQ